MSLGKGNIIFEQNIYDENQYSLLKIILIWASVTLPMILLAWVVAPYLVKHIDIHPGIVFWILMIAGMVWQFIVSIIILLNEQSSWTFAQLKQRLWLNRPIDPKDNKGKYWLFLMLIPAFVFSYASGFMGADYLDSLMELAFPNLKAPEYTEITGLISPEFTGQWWLLWVAIISSIFNYFLGEALLFHGILLPKMRGVFGKWAWAANAFFFGIYHLHLITKLPSIIISNIAYSFPSQRYKSNWFAIIVHGFEGIFLIGAVIWVINGMPK